LTVLYAHCTGSLKGSLLSAIYLKTADVCNTIQLLSLQAVALKTKAGPKAAQLAGPPGGCKHAYTSLVLLEILY